MILKWIQNKRLNGPARNLQKNSNFPAGSAPSSVKKYIRVKKARTKMTGRRDIRSPFSANFRLSRSKPPNLSSLLFHRCCFIVVSTNAALFHPAGLNRA